MARYLNDFPALVQLLTEINFLQLPSGPSRFKPGILRDSPINSFHQLCEALGHPEHKLFTYGSLQPGHMHHELISYPGEWQKARIRGVIRNPEWNKKGGYPSFHWDESSAWVHGHMFISENIDWPSLDTFEGEDYCRIWVPVYSNSGPRMLTIGSVYATRISGN